MSTSEVRFGGIACGLDEVRPRYRAELRPDEDARPLLDASRTVVARLALDVAPPLRR